MLTLLIVAVPLDPRTTPYQSFRPEGLTDVNDTGLSAVPFTSNVPLTSSSTSAAEVPEASASVLAACTETPGSTVRVTPAPTVTSPAPRTHDTHCTHSHLQILSKRARRV
jgi:hypothetical protein